MKDRQSGRLSRMDSGAAKNHWPNGDIVTWHAFIWLFFLWSDFCFFLSALSLFYLLFSSMVRFVFVVHLHGNENRKILIVATKKTRSKVRKCYGLYGTFTIAIMKDKKISLIFIVQSVAMERKSKRDNEWVNSENYLFYWPNDGIWLFFFRSVCDKWLIIML